MGHFLVFAHEPAVTDHICDKDGGKPALNALFDHDRPPGHDIIRDVMSDGDLFTQC